MAKRFIADSAGVRVSRPGSNVDDVSPYELLFSSERFALSGALIGSFFMDDAEYSSNDGYPYGYVRIDLPPGSGQPIWWVWHTPLTPQRTTIYTSHLEAENQLEFKVWRNRENFVHYLIYRNRT